MQYTLFELERIEKILHRKLEEARDALSTREEALRLEFKTKVEREEVSINPTGPTQADINKALHEKFKELKENDMDWVFLWGEVDLFERGINALYSYWNSSVEIFIDSMREKVEKEYPERSRLIKADSDDV